MAVPQPVLPAYGGPCLDGVVPAVLRRGGHPPDWLPAPAVEATQVVLLVLDGLGWQQLQERPSLAPTLSAMTGGPVTSVAPSTTATALTSLTTGAPPAAHGVMGYRVRVGDDQVLNVLRWRTGDDDARQSVPPARFCPLEPFGGIKPAVVTRAEFADSGFTAVHLAGARLQGWRVPSTLVVHVRDLLAAGESFVYAYYDGVDKVAHEYGLGDMYDAELAAADRLAADLLDVLPAGAALLVTSDHGQVNVGDAVVPLAAEVMSRVRLLSGEGRFRWLHAHPGTADDLLEAARQAHEDSAWVVSRDQAVDAGWFGDGLGPEAASRLGDVAVVAHRPVAFVDPADTGEVNLRSRHGSLTPAEMWVPLVGARPW